MYAVDMHVHAAGSGPDGAQLVEQIVASANRVQLDGLCDASHILPDDESFQAAMAGLSPAAQVASLRLPYDLARSAAATLGEGPQIFFAIEYRVPRSNDDLLIFVINSCLDQN